MPVNLTPARQQYLEIKAQYPDALLWFRLGDFYEMFDEDAKLASSALRITLTSRTFGKDCRVPMCGVPHHAQARFLARLVRQGYNVAICEQVSAAGKGLVERRVVRVVTPGTISEPEILRPGENNYLAAIACRNATYALASVDVTTGEFRFSETGSAAALADELRRLEVAECLIEDPGLLPSLPARHTLTGEPGLWDSAAAMERLLRHLGSRALHQAGCHDRPAAIAAAGAVLGYLERTNRSLLPVLQTLRPYTLDDAVAIDHATQGMLLGRSNSSSERSSSLYGLLGNTLTAMGTRLLSRWLRRPLQDLEQLCLRQEAVAEMLETISLREAVRRLLRGQPDLERLTARTAQERATPEELFALLASLDGLPALVVELASVRCEALHAIADDLDPVMDVAATIRARLAEPGSTRLMRDGVDRELDLLAATAEAARTQLATLEATERARTGIKSLKVGYNQIFGYYLEITSPNLPRVPSNYVRKQTLAHGERFVTADLLHWEAILSEADARLQELDQQRYTELQQGIAREAWRLLRTADALARIDLFSSLAEVAEVHGFVRPELLTSTEITIEEGRHPVVEAALGAGAFIPNDCVLGGANPHLAIVTGPNMGGKSTYLRQIAMIVYLAQIGSYVPARRARIGVADRICARVGAHDDLAAGHSTFLVEMAETAAIVRLATPRSLVLLDEIGRGTSSYDGLAIARAVAEHLHEVVGARTLFATHYYELARAAEGWPQACNLRVRAEEHDQDVVFLYRVEKGMADKSFALHVARMAGMPEPITLRAEDLLAAMATSPAVIDPPVPEPIPILPPAPAPATRAPLRLAETPVEFVDDLLGEILCYDLASMTPIDALNGLHALQQQARRLRRDGHSISSITVEQRGR